MTGLSKSTENYELFQISLIFDNRLEFFFRFEASLLLASFGDFLSFAFHIIRSLIYL